MKLAHTPKFNETSINQVLKQDSDTILKDQFQQKLNSRCLFPMLAKLRSEFQTKFEMKLSKDEKLTFCTLFA